MLERKKKKEDDDMKFAIVGKAQLGNIKRAEEGKFSDLCAAALHRYYCCMPPAGIDTNNL